MRLVLLSSEPCAEPTEPGEFAFVCIVPFCGDESSPFIFGYVSSVFACC